MENELEFCRSQRVRVLNLIRDLNKELILVKLDFVNGSITSEEFLELRDSINFKIDVAKEVDEELIKNIIIITNSLSVVDDCESEWWLLVREGNIYFKGGIYMSFERMQLLKKKSNRILKTLSWTIDAYCKRELSDEEFDALFKILDENHTEVREELNRYAE